MPSIVFSFEPALSPYINDPLNLDPVTAAVLIGEATYQQAGGLTNAHPEGPRLLHVSPPSANLATWRPPRLHTNGKPDSPGTMGHFTAADLVETLSCITRWS